jgi:hypothetical protein
MAYVRFARARSRAKGAGMSKPEPLTKEQLRDRFEAAIRIKRGTASYLTAIRDDGEYVETWAIRI